MTAESSGAAPDFPTAAAQRGRVEPSRLFSLRAGDALLNGAARVFDADADADGGGQVAGNVRFDWDSLDWFEEDEPIVGHPRNPYARVVRPPNCGITCDVRFRRQLNPLG